MCFKAIIYFTCCLLTSLSAEPSLQFHDGVRWREIDSNAWDRLPRTEQIGKARDGKERRYSGVAMSEVLKLLGAPSGDGLRGAEMNRVVLLRGKDCYQVVFSLAELDSSFRASKAIIADHVDGQALSDFEGPSMLIVPDDLKHSRWIRQITSITLLRVEPPKP